MISSNSHQLLSRKIGMADKVLFNVDREKALEAIVWLADKMPNIDIYHIGKVLFYADKSHLNKHGRPVIGDNYVKMKYGPAPSTVLDIINLNSYNIEPEFLDEIEKAIGSTGRNKNTVAKRGPDIQYFSKSDLRCLERSLEENGRKSFDMLYRETHAEKSYEQTEDSDFIDYRLMVDDTTELAEEIKSFIYEQSDYLQC